MFLVSVRSDVYDGLGEYNTILYIGINDGRNVYLLMARGIHGLNVDVSVDVAQPL